MGRPLFSGFNKGTVGEQFSLHGALFSFTSADVDFPKLCSNWVGMV